MELFISAPRGHRKLELAMFDMIADASTHGKKKKAFLKWLRACGVRNKTIDSFVHWIKENKGKYSYNWPVFKWYLLTKYFPIKGGTEE